MKTRIYFLVLMLFASKLIAQTATDIYTVQQNSSLIGKSVSVIGVVTVSTEIFSPQETIIAEPDGSAWSAVIVRDDDALFYAQAGTKARIIGVVSEREGMIEIQLEAATLFSGSYRLPQRDHLQTADLAAGSPTAESYESVVVQLDSVQVIDRDFAQGIWLIDDGSRPCRVANTADYLFYDVPENGSELISICGIVRYRSGNYVLEPRYRSDIRESQSSSAFDIYAVQQDIALIGEDVTITGVVSAATGLFDPRKTFIADSHGGPWSGVLLWDSTATFQANTGDELRVNGEIFEFDGMTTIALQSAEILNQNQAEIPVERVATGDISTGSRKAEIYEGVLAQVTDVFVADPGPTNGEWLVDDGSGSCRIGRDADSLVYDVPSTGSPINSIIGVVSYADGNFILEPRSRSDIHEAASIPIGDTLTLIQRPIQNIPAMVVPGEPMSIQCDAAPNTSGWTVELLHAHQSISLAVQSAGYDPVGGWWTLSVEIPDLAVTGLYDLKVSANDLPEDIARNAVSVIREFKDDYYFIHITDPHLPTHIFLRDGASEADTTEMVDLREVIDDINIINPEFVLLTGDLVNEGELEEHQHLRYFTKAQRLLTELKVPFYLSSGNHDLGGWWKTPPPDGTARRTWWQFFGWKRLNDPPISEPWYTQNYSFDYGPVHYIGLEGYQNYDRWREEIYGESSFTAGQMQWLQDDLAAASASAARVLFYHYDFKDELDLNALGVEMALWGHSHKDLGDLEGGVPYNIGTRAVCDGNRAYRLIRVSNGILQASPTIDAGWYGENLSTEFQPANDGSHNSVTAEINNTHDERFENALLRFHMPKSNSSIAVSGGKLAQVDSSGPTSICYVQVDIPPLSESSVTVSLFSNPFAEECSVNKPYLQPGLDTLHVRSKVVNPRNENILVEALITATEPNFRDSLLMFDDGEHADEAVGDGIYGADWPVPAGERFYQLTLRTLAADSVVFNELKNAAKFTTVGPVIYENMTIVQQIGDLYRIRLKLRNSGTETSAAGVNAELTVQDTSITIEENYRYFGDIAAGKTAQSYSFYNFMIPDAPDGMTELSLRIFSNDELYWQDNFAFNFSGTSVSGPDREIPTEFALRQNYPNPFNPRTSIEYSLAQKSDVQLSIYDVNGSIVDQWFTRNQNPGYYSIEWDASNLSSGVYFYRIQAGNFRQVKKCLYLK